MATTNRNEGDIMIIGEFNLFSMRPIFSLAQSAVALTVS
jgi:hypothetical protein